MTPETWTIIGTLVVALTSASIAIASAHASANKDDVARLEREDAKQDEQIKDLERRLGECESDRKTMHAQIAALQVELIKALSLTKKK